MRIARLKDQLKRTFIVPIVLAILLVSFSTLIGWNLMTLFLFWFILIPILAVYLSNIISKNNNHLTESLAGLVIFYGGMVFMIFDHYRSDYFKIMLLSGLINLVLITVISFTIPSPKQKNNISLDHPGV